MFNLFKDRPADVKTIRNLLLQFIKEKLQRAEGGEGANITGIHLFINCTDNERHLYESAVFANNPGKFKSDELQKMADDYAIMLPASWTFEVAFTDKFPEQCYIAKDVAAALFITTRKAGLSHKKSHAYIKVLSGQAEKEIYTIDASTGKINIGREAKVQVAGGFVRKNGIAFISTGATEMNRSVSRQHAHIEWEPGSGSFLVFADEGGIPPHTKLKVRTAEGISIKMQAMEIGHRLQEGDQLILGDAAVLEFTYSGD
ncbi:MAG: FHA domain-containing protein [Ferruginibacter sp.]|nr:FHA domain-containing protein [Ferruginibacter sp.]